MEVPPKTDSKKSWLLKLLLKLAVTAVCIWYVSGKIDFVKAGAAIKNANGLFLLLALAAFVASKLFSAARLNIYFRNIHIQLSEKQNVKLYWLGMFYNLFLPGSISGDAYKVIRLKKKYTIPYKKATAAVLLDRFSGLLGLGLILAVYGIIVLHEAVYVFVLTIGSVSAVVVFYIIVKKWFIDFIPGFFTTLLWGLLVQASQVICVYLIMAALKIPAHVTEYIFLFLVSSVVAVLPLTIGGLGAREIVFLEGAAYFGLQQEISVVISLLFYLITLITSAWGLWYVFNDPLMEKEKDPLLSP